mgnify:CR=1 FL=1
MFDDYTVWFIFGTIFGLIAGVVGTLLTCVVWVPKKSSVEFIPLETIKEDDKNKVLRPFKFDLTARNDHAVIIKGEEAKKIIQEITRKKAERAEKEGKA